MTVKEHTYYKCNVCGSAVVALKAGDGTLVCCDQEMEEVGGDEAKRMMDMMPKPGTP